MTMLIDLKALGPSLTHFQEKMAVLPHKHQRRYFAMVTNTRTINMSEPFPRKWEKNNWQGALF